MPRTRDLGQFYCHTLSYPFDKAPRYEKAWTVEVEPPFRRGGGWAVRIGRHRALVVGRWRPGTGGEDEALREALAAVELDVAAETIRVWE